MTISNDELFQMMETASQMRDELQEKMDKIRACKRACSYNKYHYDKQHREMIASACDAPAGFGEWGAEMSTMQVEKGKEIGFYKSGHSSKKHSNKSGQSAYIRALERKLEAEKARN